LGANVGLNDKFAAVAENLVISEILDSRFVHLLVSSTRRQRLGKRESYRQIWLARDFIVRRIAYLLSQYPTYNHTFLLREVRLLRALGLTVDVASLGSPDRSLAALPTIEREEAESSTYIKQQGLTAAAASYLWWCIRAPGRSLAATRLALRVAGPHPRRVAAHIAYLGQACLVADWLRRTGHQRLHSHFCSTVAMLAGELSGVPWSVTIHGPSEFDDVVGFALSEKVARAAQVIAISFFAQSQVLRHVAPQYWEKVSVVPLGIDPADYTPPPARAGGERAELLTVGRLAPVKAQSLLIAAVRQLRDEGRLVRLRIVGTGPDEERLAALIASYGLEGTVVLVGPLPADAVTRMYAETDIFALPSFAEGVPVVLMEAMAMERPCLSSRLMGIPELIEDGVNGILVRPADVDDVAHGLRILLDDPALGRRLGIAARKSVVSRYDLRTNVALLASTLVPE